jgi:hypothetical protein
MKIIFKIVVILTFLTTTSVASAEIYKWVDEKGTINFTDDPVTIPQEYWGKIESRKTEEDRMTIRERVKAKQEQEKRAKESIEGNKQEYQMALQKENKPKTEKQIMQSKKESEAEIKKEEKLRKLEDPYEKSWSSYGKGLTGVKLSTPKGGSANTSKKSSIYDGKGKLKK